MWNGKAMITHLTVGLIKKALYKVSQYFPKSYRTFGGNINATVNLSNYATKADLKNVAGFDKLAANQFWGTNCFKLGKCKSNINTWQI